MSDPADFIARWHAAIQVERERFAEWQLEDELEHELKALEYKFEAVMKREREKHRKYWEAMVRKRASGSTAAPDRRQCTRCHEWKHLSCFHDYDGGAMLPESRHVCRACFANWLDEKWAREHPH